MQACKTKSSHSSKSHLVTRFIKAKPPISMHQIHMLKTIEGALQLGKINIFDA
jgi:hypothetical protein